MYLIDPKGLPGEEAARGQPLLAVPAGPFLTLRGHLRRPRGSLLASLLAAVVLGGLPRPAAPAEAPTPAEPGAPLPAQADPQQLQFPTDAVEPAANDHTETPSPQVRYAAERLQRLLGRAQVLAAEGRLRLAREHLTPALISPWLTTSARADAYFYRGLLYYLDGLPVSAALDYARALQYAPDHPRALSATAWLHLQGEGVQASDVLAADYYRRAADLGHAEAQVNLGLLHLNGRGVDSNPATARSLFQQAAEQGNPKAMAHLGRLLRSGEGGPADPAAAHHWLEQAAAAGSAEALRILGFMHRRGELGDAPDHAAAHRHFLAAAELDDPVAQVALAWGLLTGTGTSTDPEQARSWYERAAASGQVDAFTGLAWIHETGTGVPRDPAQALHWYRQAAEAGSVAAQSNLGFMYHAGIGTARDPAQAMRWLEAAAAQGDNTGRNALAWLLATAPEPDLRNGQRAVDLAEDVVADEPVPAYLDTLAAAYAETGDFSRAQDLQQQALAALGPEEELRGEFEERLRAYRDGQAWREALDN